VILHRRRITTGCCASGNKTSHRVHVRRGEPFADAPRGNGWRLEEETEEDEWNPCTADRIGRYGRAHRASRKRQREMLASLMLSWLSGWHPYAPPSAGERSEAFTENSDPLCECPTDCRALPRGDKRMAQVWSRMAISKRGSGS
jgi:hypothetical protein